MATAQPAGQQRNAFGRDWGNYATVATMPNGSGLVLPSASVPFNLEAGDRCYLTLSGSECEYLCVSAGTSGGANAVWVPSSGQGPWSSVLYVDNVRGNDLTGARGNANLPYQTIQAAVNGAQTGDEIYIAPQNFATVAAITIPAAVVRLSFVGQTRGYVLGSATTNFLGTQIRCTGDHAFNLGTNLGLAKVYFANIQITTATAGKFAIFADGSLYASAAFLAGGLILQNVDTGTNGAVSSKYVLSTIVTGGVLTGPFSFVNCLAAVFYGVQAAGSAVTLSADLTDPLCPQAQPTFEIRGGTVLGGLGSTSFLTWSGQASIRIDPTSVLGGLKASGLSTHTGPTANPGISCAGYIGAANGGVVDLGGAGSEIPDVAAALTFDFRGTRFYANVGANLPNGGPSTIKAKVGGAAANFQTVQLDDTQTLPACTVTADVKTHITGRGASWPQVVLTTPGADGDIIPPQITGTIDLSAGGVGVAKTWVNLGYAGFIRAGAAPDTAFATSNAPAADCVITVKATVGLTFTSAVAVLNTAVNWLAIWK